MAGTATRARAPALDAPVSALRGAGPKIAEKLKRLGIETVGDLLFHLPLRYQDRTRIQPIGALKPGTEAQIEGEVELAEIAYRRRRMLVCRLCDGTGAVLLRFFHFNQLQHQALKRGVRLRCYGQVRAGPGILEMVHPEYIRLDPARPQPVARTLTPVYPTTAGLSQHWLRRLAGQVLDGLKDGDISLPDYLPPSILRRHHYPDLNGALQYVHRPPPKADTAALEAGTHPAQQRLKFEELLAHHLGQRRLREQARNRAAPAMQSGGRLQARLIGHLPFALTAAQQRVLGEIETDLVADRPMLRLLQGDVGSGKTIVAALAAARVLEAGWQVALMAPTEMLAEQHYQNLCDWFAPLDIQPLLLTGRSRRTIRRDVMASMDTDTPAIVVGTHALFQEDMRFARLGLVIIDEQHRFGVHQRLRLLDKGGDLCPHQLIMTATPIPRTLAMAMHADLDVSIIDALPPGRTPVTTAVMPETRRDELIERIRNACRAGRQVYWVCPLIEESEILECQAAAETAEELSQRLKPDIRVGLVHGRMPARAKHAAMHEFKTGRLQVLVATTVIEVGMDIPGASLMIIENAERLGLAQLHQLRGRVGRGFGHSDCILLYRAPLSDLARRRLEAIRKTNDGFVIAERDLELRGPGELLGTRQTGLPQMRIADLARDSHLIARLKPAGDLMLRDCPENIEPLIARWRGQWLDYGIV